MWEPRKTKFKKQQKGRSRKRLKEFKGVELSFGSFGMQAQDACWLTTHQLEAVRRVLLRYLKKRGKFWFRIFPQKPITSKGNEVPMGGGKGAVVDYVVPVRPGRIIVEIDGVEEGLAKEIIKQASAKLPIKVKFIKRLL